MAESDPPFTIDCSAGFRNDGVWVIQATLRFPDGRPSDGSPLLGHGRLALLEAIAQAGLRGRSKGATTARVFLDEGLGQVVELDTGGVLARLTRQ